ncbi:MAG: hypothetical protein Q7T57_01270 [Dehalococcoidales bacterium]|nr:hypothetical protein [Dehalococcoidales bacterium]
MVSDSQQAIRWQNILGQAFFAASAGLLFITTSSSWSIMGVDWFIIIGGASFLFSFILMFSALGVHISWLEGLLSWAEKATNWLWGTFAVINIPIILSAWVTGKPKIEDKWLTGLYDWSVPIWFILFTVILMWVGLVAPLVRYSRRDGFKVTARKYSLWFAIIFAGLALASNMMLQDTISIGYILSFQSLTVLMLIVRILVRD